MNSANSGSIQSSSGRDDNNHDFDSISAPNQLQFLPQNPNFFDSSNIPNDNHDLVWPRVGTLRSEPNFAYFGTLTASTPPSSLPSTASQPDPTATVQATFPGPSPSMDHAARPPPQPSNAIRNPKKRTRASRRAPTTVLTTDVTNFRQMVQEFTGIPASPFSGSPYSRSFDLFSAASALRTGGNLHSLRPPYLPRPSPATKLPSPFSSSNSIAIGNNNPNDDNNPSSFHLFNLQQQQNQRNINPLQLGANSPINLGSLSGFLNREAAQPMRPNDGDARTVGRTNDGGIDGNHNVVGFDGGGRGAPPHLSGYNLNVAEKGMENAAGSSSGGGGGAAGGEGTVGSWICTSH